MSLFGKKEQKDDFQRQGELNRQSQEFDYASSTSPEEQYFSATGMPSPDLTKWQQDVDPYIQKMILKLKRQWKDSDGNFHFIDKKRLPPLCSDECVENMVGLLQSNTTPNTMLSKFSEAQISNMEVELEKTLILDVLIPERRKHNTPLSYLSQVKKIFRSFALPTFFRALKGFESQNQRQIRTVKELHSNTGGNLGRGEKEKFSLFGA